jgi:hypothetical protein
MQTFLQPGQSDRRPTWLRLMALLCVLMVCVMSTIQVAHNHTESAPLKQSQNHNGPVPDDHCPLCVAMHSALPVSMHAPEPILQIHALDSVAANAERIFRWRFEMASRPPPADADRA